MEAHISDLLFDLAYEANVQVISTTHSAVFVRALENPHSLVRLFRNPEGDLTAHQTTQSVFGDASDTEQKEYRLRAIREFGTDVSALFFARRVVLVEGATEIMVLQHAAQLLGAFDHGVSLINCHGRGNIPLFQEVLNHFDLTYYVVHDLEHEQAHEGMNQHILNLLDNNEARRFYHSPHIDALLGVNDSPKWLDAYDIVEDLYKNRTLQETLGDLVSFVYPRYKNS